MTDAPTESPSTSNFAKFATRNPLARLLFDRFFLRVRSLVTPLTPLSVLDAGCGEGETIARLRDILPVPVTGFDTNPACIDYARRRHPGDRFLIADIHSLPWPDRTFDLVLCLEVLEHLADPARALSELCRVARRAVVVSVPHEPFWSLTNLARLKYVQRLGHHPEHIQRFSRRSLRLLLLNHDPAPVITSSWPWLIARLQPCPDA